MIRINLLPDSRRHVGSSNVAQMWGVAYMLAGFATCVMLFLFHLSGAAALDEQRAKNAELQENINRSEAQSADLASVEAELAKSRELEQLANRLQSSQRGPTRLLMELSRILSVGGGPTVDPEVLQQLRRDNPLGGYNPAWDVRRLSLAEFREQGGQCQISGVGKTNEDVAEFLRRLDVSELFEAVVLQNTVTRTDRTTGVPTVAFELSCRVHY